MLNWLVWNKYECVFSVRRFQIHLVQGGRQALDGQPVDSSASSESCCWLMSLCMPRKWSPVECTALSPLPAVGRFPTDTVAPQRKFNQQWDTTLLSAPPPHRARYWWINTKKSMIYIWMRVSSESDILLASFWQVSLIMVLFLWHEFSDVVMMSGLVVGGCLNFITTSSQSWYSSSWTSRLMSCCPLYSSFGVAIIIIRTILIITLCTCTEPALACEYGDVSAGQRSEKTHKLFWCTWLRVCVCGCVCLPGSQQELF